MGALDCFVSLHASFLGQLVELSPDGGPMLRANALLAGSLSSTGCDTTTPCQTAESGTLFSSVPPTLTSARLSGTLPHPMAHGSTAHADAFGRGNMPASLRPHVQAHAHVQAQGGHGPFTIAGLPAAAASHPRPAEHVLSAMSGRLRTSNTAVGDSGIVGDTSVSPPAQQATAHGARDADEDTGTSAAAAAAAAAHGRTLHGATAAMDGGGGGGVVDHAVSSASFLQRANQTARGLDFSLLDDQLRSTDSGQGMITGSEVSGSVRHMVFANYKPTGAAGTGPLGGNVAGMRTRGGIVVGACALVCVQACVCE